MTLNELEIEIEGYSGPFDLLCSLVENRKFRVAEIKISQLIKIYGLYLTKTRQAPADTLAEFFYMTAGLLLEKTKSLLPGAKSEEISTDNTADEEKFMRSLERYRPYRKAYLFLAEKFSEQSKIFTREVLLETAAQEVRREIVIDGSGVYLLAKTWKELHAKHEEFLRTGREILERGEKAVWNGFTQLENEQIEERILELERELEISRSLSFNEICRVKKNFVVTLLALLELCRMGKIFIEQDELFSDVRISAKD